MTLKKIKTVITGKERREDGGLTMEKMKKRSVKNRKGRNGRRRAGREGTRLDKKKRNRR